MKGSDQQHQLSWRELQGLESFGFEQFPDPPSRQQLGVQGGQSECEQPQRLMLSPGPWIIVHHHLLLQFAVVMVPIFLDIKSTSRNRGKSFPNREVAFCKGEAPFLNSQYQVFSLPGVCRRFWVRLDASGCFWMLLNEFICL